MMKLGVKFPKKKVVIFKIHPIGLHLSIATNFQCQPEADYNITNVNMAVTTKDGQPLFAAINEEEFLELLKIKDSANTQRETEKSVKAFRGYLTSKRLPVDFEQCYKPRLSEVLSMFYVEVRREYRTRLCVVRYFSYM